MNPKLTSLFLWFLLGCGFFYYWISDETPPWFILLLTWLYGFNMAVINYVPD